MRETLPGKASTPDFTSFNPGYSLLAATVKVHRMTLVTRNSDVADLGADVSIHSKRLDAVHEAPVVATRLRHAQAIVLRERVDLDDDLLDRSARRPASADAPHRDEAGGLQLRQRPREVGLSAPRHLHQFGNRTWFAIANERKQPTVLRRQQADQGVD